MPFTKAQRLKGLKKQLKNLGYDIVSQGTSNLPKGASSTAPPDDYDMDPELEKRARKQIIAWDNAKDVEQF